MFRLIFLLLIFITSCGIDSYVFLSPVEYITFESANTLTTFRLPNNQDDHCLNYKIFYKIYLSKSDNLNIDEDGLWEINEKLSNDSNKTHVYSEEESSITSAVNYLLLNFKDVLYIDENSNTNIDLLSQGFLGADFKGAKLVIDFLNDPPTISYDGITYTLHRGVTVDKEDLPFIFSNKFTETGKDYDPLDNETYKSAWVLLVIVGEGFDDNFSPIYSAPRRLGIFKLK